MLVKASHFMAELQGANYLQHLGESASLEILTRPMLLRMRAAPRPDISQIAKVPL